MLKNVAKEIAIITIVSAALAISYNVYFSAKKLPLIREEVKLDQASISDLLGPADTTSTASAYSLARIKQQQRTADSLAAVEQRSLTDEIKRTEDSLKAIKKLVADSIKKAQLAAKQTQQVDIAAASGEVKSVSYEQVLQLVKRNDVVFVDARKEEEHVKGHIPNSQNIDIHKFEEDMDFQRATVPKIYSFISKPIVVYCGGGACELSHELANKLKEFGAKRVFIYLGGWNEYSAKQGIK